MKLIRLLSPYWPLVSGAVLIALVPALAQAFLPSLLVKPLFDEVLAKGSYQELSRLLLTGLALIALVAAGGYLQEAFMGFLAVRVPKDLRERLQVKLLGVDLALLPASAGALAGRILADLREMESFIFFGLGTLVIQGTSLLALLALMLARYGALTLYLLAALPLLALVLGSVARRVATSSSKTQAAAERLAGNMAEGFGRIELVRALDMLGFARKRFGADSERYYRLGLRRTLLSALYLPVAQVTTAIIIGLLVFLGVGQVKAGTLSTGDLTAFVTLLALSITPLQTLSRGGMLAAQAEGAAGRLAELFDLAQAPSFGKHIPQTFTGKIEFKQVSFGYAGEELLRDFDLEIPAGSMTAIVGPSGAGKSSVLRLTLGLQFPASGEVFLDDVSITQYHPAFLRRQFAWVPQEPWLFGGSVRENLQAFAPRASEAQMLEALAGVKLLDELPQGLDTPLAVEGVGLSVGQRQRLAIAGALLRQPAILVLDEATSALDAHGEERVIRALKDLKGKATILLVAHRLSSVRYADRIVVLDQGRVIESGTHQSLLAQEGAYYALWQGARLE